MSNYKKIIACAGICVLALTGCSSGVPELPEQVNTTTIAVDEAGAVTFYLVDSFDKDYYDVAELKAMVVEDAAQYNTENQIGTVAPITVEKVAKVGNVTNDVVVTYKFMDDDTYEDYVEGELFYGTVTEAMAAGYQLSDFGLSSVKDGTAATEEWLTQKAGEQHILITNAKAAIYCPFKVTHVSQGAVYQEDGSVDAAQAEGSVYILMKK